MSRKKSTIEQKTLKKFGERLFLLRKSTGMSQRDFAKTIGISGNYVSYLENGLSTPSETVLRSIESQYLINFNEILKGAEFSLEKSRQLYPEPEIPLVNEKSSVYTTDRNEEIAMLLKMTSEILNSDTQYARALETNIQAFYRAVTDKTKCNEDHQELKKRVENLEKKKNCPRSVGNA